MRKILIAVVMGLVLSSAYSAPLVQFDFYPDLFPCENYFTLTRTGDDTNIPFNWSNHDLFGNGKLELGELWCFMEPGEQWNFEFRWTDLDPGHYVFTFYDDYGDGLITDRFIQGDCALYVDGHRLFECYRFGYFDKITANFTIPAPPPAPPPSLIDSGLVSGQRTWTVIRRDYQTYRFRAYTHRLSDSRQITENYVGVQDFVDAIALADGNAMEARLLTLAVNDDALPLLRTYELPEGVLAYLRQALTESYQVLDLEALGDINYDGVSDYAVLGKHRSTNEAVVQVRNGNDGLLIKDVPILNPNWTPQQLLALPDFPGWIAPKIGVLATNEAGQIVVSVIDLHTEPVVNDLFFLNANWTPIEALALPSFGNTMAAEIGLCARHKTSGKVVVSIKDAASGTLVNTVIPLGSNWEVSKVIAMGDMDGNGASELAILAVHKDTGQIVVEIRDAATDDRLKTLKPLGSDWTPSDMLAYGIGAGQQLVIAADHKTDNVTVVQTLDVNSGALVGQAFVH